MPGQPTPSCPTCKTPMEPLYARREPGGMPRPIDQYWCGACGMVAKGRENPVYYPA